MAISIIQIQRITSVVAGTLVALACGTNYVYSAWGPQFAERMKLSSKESNLIGAAGNFGMYVFGIPMGYLVDTRGPRIAMVLGALALGAGYYPIHIAYRNGQGSISIPLLLVFSSFTGLGGCSAFLAAIKAAATNFPNHRGTATAFPLAGFGLSAFFFSTLSALVFKDDTGQFLLLLAVGTSTIILFSMLFIRITPVSVAYSALPRREPGDQIESRWSHGANPADRRPPHSDEAGTQSTTSQTQPQIPGPSPSASPDSGPAIREADPDETSSLVSQPTSPRISHESSERQLDTEIGYNSHYPDLRGLAMLPKVEFWQLFLTMGLLSGIGLMTINNIGNNAWALWKYYDDSVTPKFILQQQVAQVSILSIFSFVGRLLSGIGSDLLVKKLHMSRFWCLFLSALVFTLTQLAGLTISNPHGLTILSVLTGLAYGFLFGVFPSLVAHIFGIGGLSQNWGIMTLAPVFSGNIFNLFYGTIYDGHSVISPGGVRDCREGLECYRAAYGLTLLSGLAGVLVCLWSIWQEKRVHGANLIKLEHERLA